LHLIRLKLLTDLHCEICGHAGDLDLLLLFAALGPVHLESLLRKVFRSDPTFVIIVIFQVAIIIKVTAFIAFFNVGPVVTIGFTFFLFCDRF
jgi:hypothetical protein